MIRHGKKLRLSPRELDFLSTYSGEPVNPTTVAEYNAWWEHIRRVTEPISPEERLVLAIVDEMKISD